MMQSCGSEEGQKDLSKKKQDAKRDGSKYEPWEKKYREEKKK
jgi:hypothetical protein